MKINVPLTEEEHKRADEQYEHIAESQKDFINQMAEKIEAGETLTTFECSFVAAVLRGAADGIRTKRPRRRGSPDKLPGELAVWFGLKTRVEGMSDNAAAEELAGKYGTSVEAVKKTLGLTGKDSGAKRKRAETEAVLSTMPPKKT